MGKRPATLYILETSIASTFSSGGKIVGMSSIASSRGLPTAAPYCASKVALSTFLESLRLDLKPLGIEV
ncbi:MAG: SDR family NAD(P)-dependent oxidoreductase, partial [Terriglobia bacterium]